MTNEEIMNNAREINFFGLTLKDAMKTLQTYKEIGANVYIEFNTQKLYSLIDDLDSAYVKVTGKTYLEFEREQALGRIKRIQEELKALDNIPEWNKRGKALIYPQQYNEWKETVFECAKGVYLGFDIENALQIMEALAHNDMEAAYKLFLDGNHSGSSASEVFQLVAKYSDQGANFIRFVCQKEGRTMSPQFDNTLKKYEEAFEKYREEGNAAE